MANNGIWCELREGGSPNLRTSAITIRMHVQDAEQACVKFPVGSPTYFSSSSSSSSDGIAFILFVDLIKKVLSRKRKDSAK